MKVLIDTNILISAMLRNSKPEAVILWIITQYDWRWMASPAIMDEYRGVLHRKKFNFTAEFIQQWTELLYESITLCEPNITIDFQRDLKDSKFLSCARFTNADVLVTGDNDFQDAQQLVDTLIVSPSEFLKIFMERHE
jgi:putative PIN family toxin of toxin-antitoxin system